MLLLEPRVRFARVRFAIQVANGRSVESGIYATLRYEKILR